MERCQTAGQLRDIDSAQCSLQPSTAPLCSCQSICVCLSSHKVAVGPSEAGEGIGRHSNHRGGVESVG